MQYLVLTLYQRSQINELSNAIQHDINYSMGEIQMSDNKDIPKSIGTPRPPKKDGAIKFQYGRFEGELDFLVLYGNGVPRCDRSLVMQAFTSKVLRQDWNNDGKVIFEDSFIEELEKRGYDTSTIKFYIEKKESNYD